MFKSTLVAGLMLVSSAVAPSALANWQVDSSTSDIQFVSIKKNSIAETHHFTQFGGQLSAQGELSFAIELASVESLIPIRNERMQQMLFEVAAFPKATVKAEVSKQLGALKPGLNQLSQVPATLSLHGKTHTLLLDLNVVKAGNDLLVSTRKPIIINAKDFALDAGIEALRKVAGLDSIAQAVPVSVSLNLVKK